MKFSEIITEEEQYEIAVALTVLAWAAWVFNNSLPRQIKQIKEIG